MAVIFMEAGAGATGGLHFYASAIGQIFASNSTSKFGDDDLRCVPTSGNAAYVTFAPVPPTSGRISFWYNFAQLMTTNTTCILRVDRQTATAFAFSLHVTAAGVFKLFTASGTTQIGVDGTISAIAGFIFRPICVCWAVTSLTVYTITVYLEGVPIISATNDTALLVGSNDNLALGSVVARSDAQLSLLNFACIFVDDSASLNDTGPILVEPRQATALNTNSFDTLGGSGTNRYDRISDIPLSEANYIAHLGATDVQENFALRPETTAARLSTVYPVSLQADYFARTAWVWAKAGAVLGTGTPKATGSGAANSSGTLVTATLSAQVNAGDLVYLTVADQMAGAAPTITDSAGGNTWNPLTTATNTIRASKWYSILTNGASALVITATFGSANASRAIAACAWDGSLFLASPLNTDPALATDSVTPFTCPLSGTLAQATELVVGSVFSAGSSTFTATSPNLLGVTVASSGGSAATNAAIAIGYQVTAATTSIAPVFAGTSRTSAEGTTSFKLSAAKVAAGSPKIMDNGVETAIVLTTSSSLFTVTSDAAAYPNAAAGIGMRSTGAGGVNTYFYEGGALIAYIQAHGNINQARQAVKRAALY